MHVNIVTGSVTVGLYVEMPPVLQHNLLTMTDKKKPHQLRALIHEGNGVATAFHNQLFSVFFCQT